MGELIGLIAVACVAFALGFLAAAMLSSGGREDAYRAGYLAGLRAGFEGSAPGEILRRLSNRLGGDRETKP